MAMHATRSYAPSIKSSYVLSLNAFLSQSMCLAYYMLRYLSENS